MSDEGLLNKRSLTDHLVDYVKKSQCITPCTLFSPSKTRGSLCLTYSISTDDQTKNSILTLHVIRARDLSYLHPDNHLLNTYVKVKYCQYEHCSKVIYGTNSPIYDEKFSILLDKTNLSKRLTISVYNQSKSDLIGCMSFNMKTLLKTKNSSKYKWYCLLPESIGRHKRMSLNVLQNKKRQTNTTTNGILLNIEIYNRDDIQFASGYPCTVSSVKSGLGVIAGDTLLQVNDISVSRTQAKAVQKLIKNLPLPINLQFYRRNASSSSKSIKIDKIVLNSVEQHQPLKSKVYEPIDHYNQTLFMSTIHQSDETESGVGSETNPYSDTEHSSAVYEREVLRLIEIEKGFIEQIELGVQLYSRPLKHYLISSTEHGKLFQNIEKILAISRYQLNRLETLSNDIIYKHIGKIFHEKVQLICEAFTCYITGYSDACAQLKQLIKCASFEKFISKNEKKFPIEQFLKIPLNHIENLANQLDILCCTCENGNDANYLLHVLKELRQCLLYQHDSTSSAVVGTNQHHCTTTMTLNSVTGLMNTEDEQILDLQNRLGFDKNSQPITLTGRNRHIIFSGVLLLQNENKNYIETWAILLNDMLLFTQRNAIDTRLTLISSPILLTDIVDFRSSNERDDALIFLSNKPNNPFKIRYPSKCLQCAWQTILEQRLKTWQRSIHDESSSADSDLE